MCRGPICPEVNDEEYLEYEKVDVLLTTTAVEF
jgi:hypothetical protein